MGKLQGRGECPVGLQDSPWDNSAGNCEAAFFWAGLNPWKLASETPYNSANRILGVMGLCPLQTGLGHGMVWGCGGLTQDWCVCVYACVNVCGYVCIQPYRSIYVCEVCLSSYVSRCICCAYVYT